MGTLLFLSSELSFYADWTFWTAVVAAIAVVLSQLPPIHTMARRAKLNVELYSRVYLAHRVGNPIVQIHISLVNVGGRTIRIRKMSVAIRRDGKDIAALPAQVYYQTPTDVAAVLFTGLSLRSKEEWGHVVNFFDIFSRDDEERYRKSTATLQKDILKKRSRLKDKSALVKAAATSVQPFLEMFDEKFIWLAGEYALHLYVESDKQKKVFEREYRLTLFESDSAALRNTREDFKYGEGIYFDSGKYTGVNANVYEI